MTHGSAPAELTSIAYDEKDPALCGDNPLLSNPLASGSASDVVGSAAHEPAENTELEVLVVTIKTVRIEKNPLERSSVTFFMT